MTVEYTEDIENQILSHLDGWVISTEPQPTNDDTESLISEEVEETTEEATTTINDDYNYVQPFIDDIDDYVDNPNKKVESNEVERFYNLALMKAYTYCNRLNVDDLSSIEEEVFIKGVCLLTASDLWNKYNIRVNNEDMEDTYVQSYGGLLYQQSINILNSFVNQRVVTMTSLKRKRNNRNDNFCLM